MIISGKISKIIVLSLLLIAFTGAVCASDSSDAINNTQDSDSIHDSSNNAHTSIEKKNATKSVKSKYKAVNVSSYDSFNSSLTGGGFDSVTLNIKSDFKLKDNTSLNKDFRVLVINGNGRTIDGDGKCNFLNVSHDCTVYLKNITITNCRNWYAYNGVITTSSGKLSIQDCTLTKNVDNYGRLIACGNHSTLSLSNSRIINNDVRNDIIHSFNIIISNSTFSNNNAMFMISNNPETSLNVRNSLNSTESIMNYYNKQHNLSISNSLFSNNNVNKLIYNHFSSNSKLINCSFMNCTGSIIHNYKDMIVNDCIIKNNYVNNDNIINNYGQLSIINSKITNNNVRAHTSFNFTTNNNSKTIYNNNNNFLNIINSDISSNNECMLNKGFLNINNSSFTNNRGYMGGAILNYGLYKANISHSTFNSNYAKYGGAILNKKKDNNDIDVISEILEEATKYASYTENYNQKISSFKTIKTEFNPEITYLEASEPPNTYSSVINSIIYDETKRSRLVEEVVAQVTRNTEKNYQTSIMNIPLVMNYCNILGNTFVLNKAEIEGSAIFNNNTYTNITDNLFCRNGDKIGDRAILDNGSGIISNNINDNVSQYGSTIVNGENNTLINNNIFLDRSLNVKVTVNPIKSIIGENVTLKAYVIDEKGNQVTSGNIAFKLNGKTLREDGNFNTKANTLKINIRDAKATYTINAKQYLRNAKNLTATYSGNNAYTKATSNVVTAQIQKRKADLTITSTPKTVKQYETIQINIKANDITKNSKNKTALSNAKVIIKINGKTLKNTNGKTLYIKLDKNGQITYNHTIPGGTGAITSSKTPRAYSITAVLVDENYYPGTRNTTYFRITRSPTTITITKAQINKNNTLTIQATLKDYKDQNLKGNNKIIIKINGKTYIDPKTGKTKYWTIKNGNINLSDIKTDKNTTIKEVTIVTGERQAYLEGRNKTNRITRVI